MAAVGTVMRRKQSGKDESTGIEETLRVLKGTGEGFEYWTGEEVVWRPDASGEMLIGFDSKNRMVHPSDVAMHSPEDELTIVRERPAVPGLREACVIFQEGDEGNGKLVAYPAYLEDGKNPFRGVLPGVSEPLEVEWELNEASSQGGVIAYYYPFEEDRYHFKLYLGRNDAIPTWSPHPERTRAWRREPSPGHKNTVWLSWYKPQESNHWVAFAFLEGKEPARSRGPQNVEEMAKVAKVGSGLPPANAETSVSAAPAQTGRQELMIGTMGPLRAISLPDSRSVTVTVPSNEPVRAFLGDGKLVIEVSI